MPETTSGLWDASNVLDRVKKGSWVPADAWSLTWSPVPAGVPFTTGSYSGVDFTASATITISGYSTKNIEYVLIGGGGSGHTGSGANYSTYGGGGGAGGVVQGNSPLGNGQYQLVVGAGGSATALSAPVGLVTGNTGIPTTFGFTVAYGGGAGGAIYGPTVGAGAASPGGSGGGGAGGLYTSGPVPNLSFNYVSASGGSGVANQGNAGGSGFATPPTAGSGWYAGGGGGAGEAGGTDGASQGGDGVTISITGTPAIYGGGGGGGGTPPIPGRGVGGTGGGGNGADHSTTSSSGTANTGGGGGGGLCQQPGTIFKAASSGGSGRAIIRWLT